ncbi:hypothetical protein IWQ56_004257 [Coemansia nantahalensis]|uniref:Uncharacterized protein n=1 Tax=Coemansia nantahalensis TaxID=2789366 RepID=A0ACC1JK48_9FUNG|nr:hypothetical protein IWQ57_006473 [Coemansia nantahalensis]KAJ2765040.1 hypothetical protein IWQ56_004257 [Coemansia nantahalensis]
MFRIALASATRARTAPGSMLRRWHQVGPNAVRIGMVVNVAGEPQVVVDKYHGGTGRGQAVIKLGFRHAVTGARSQERFRGNDVLEVMLLVQNRYQLLYTDGDKAHMMDMRTLTELSLDMGAFEGDRTKLDFLEDGMEVIVQSLEPEPGPISWRLPPRGTYKVASVRAAVAKEKGATYVPAQLVGGGQVQVPDFVKPGDSIVVDLDQLVYVSRA